MTTETVTFNVSDYLSEDEMKNIAAQEFRAACANSSSKNFERIISNSAYDLVGELVDQHFDGKLVEVLKANTIKVIEGLSSHTVFSPPSAWDRAASKGFEHLQSLLDENKPMIEHRLRSIIANYNSEELREMVERQVGEAIIAKLIKE
jgi:hypothetical protein